MLWRTGITFALAGHVAWACGWIPGVAGFALADDVITTVQRLDTLERTVVCNDINSEIGRLRSELRQLEATLIQASRRATRG